MREFVLTATGISKAATALYVLSAKMHENKRMDLWWDLRNAGLCFKNKHK
jgi:hypothetical protein